MSARLIGVGVGPGDPELLTLKAVRTITATPVIAAIGADHRSSRARRIAAAHVRADAVELIRPMPMRCERAAGEAVYAALAAEVDEHLAAGRDVAFLCEGDPLFYGSFLGLLEQARPSWRIEVVPGISSVMAAAAAALHPLARRDEAVTVLPATVAEATLCQAAMTPGTLVILKIGRHLEKVRAALASAGRLDGAVLAIEVGGAGEAIVPLRDATDAPYFSLVLAGGGSP